MFKGLSFYLILLTLPLLLQAAQRESFDHDWRFARFGLQADGSRIAEPGVAGWTFSASASSEEIDKGNTADKALDNDPQTRWCAAGPGGGQWLLLDLKSRQQISGATIDWETDDPAYKGVVEVSDDQKQWKPLPAAGRYVRIRVIGQPGGKWASIREVHLMGADGHEIRNKPLPPGAGPEALAFDDSSWRQLDVPHDWAIEGPFRADLDGNTAKLPWRGIGWYRNHFALPAADAGKRIFVDFDGAMANAKIYCNGQFVGTWPYGYSSFRVDITPFIKAGQDNLLAVRLDTENWGSRWYPGAGIYRHVYLVKADPIHIAHWGVFVTTPQITDALGTANLAITIDNQSSTAAKVSVHSEIRPVASDGIIGDPVATTDPATIEVAPNASNDIALTAAVAHPKIWDLQTPNRYVARTIVSDAGQTVDTTDTPFGFRTIAFTHDDGFHLNGHRVQIQGTCNHHDLGALGTAVNASAIERQLKILKSFGCNALRTSHNPPSPEWLDAADRMGFLVMDEAFDCFLQSKDGAGKDYAHLFADWHEKDISAFVRRDRNHPCVILWSVGNEIPEQHLPDKFHTFGDLRRIVHQYDTTRPVTAGVSAPKETAFRGVELQLDVHGMNYAAGVYGGPDLYGKFLSYKGHETLPGFSSESASTVSSRGEYPPCDPGQVSSYDLTQPGWGGLPDQEFAALDKYPAIAGEFVWTGFDYLGEPTPVNSSRSSYFGIVDIAGFPKDRYYLYQAHWRPDFPMAHILPHWNWPGHEGKVVPVFVYTSGDEAELFLNGRSLGRKTKSKFQYRLRWDDVKYAPGELKVIAYKAGQEWAKDSVKTTGAPAKLTLSPDRSHIKADGRDLSYITLRIADQDGLTVPRSHNLVTFSIDGPGEIVATDNGDPTSIVSFQAHQRQAFNGLALVIVRALKPGTITVQAQSPGLADASVTIDSDGSI
jgi:beta-galactosidase